jgi:hypothetical protein
MTVAKDLIQLGKLVAAQHGWAEAKAFKAYEMADADKARLAASAVEILKVFPKAESGENAPMAAWLSAALAVQLERHLSAPVHVVAGVLSVDGVPVYGHRGAVDGAAVFGAEELHWSGHVWVMVGPYVVDIGLFRAAYSADCPAELARHVHSVFGQDKGLYVDLWRRTRQSGLGYEPQYVLCREEVTRLMGGAYRLIAPN